MSPGPSSSLLRFLKQLKPKVVVSPDCGAAEQGDLLHSLHSHATLLDLLEAMSPSPDTLHNIELVLLGPRIEKLVAGTAFERRLGRLVLHKGDFIAFSASMIEETLYINGNHLFYQIAAFDL